MLWSEELADFQGLPRPHWFPDEKYYYKDGKRYLHKKVPTPFQSKPGIEGSGPIRLNIENEERVISEDLCSFCGIKINENEISIRWIIEKQDFNQNPIRDWVPSDFRPMHLKCMKQARIYCPFLRTLQDNQFNVQLHKDNLKISKENFKKYYILNWKKRPRLDQN